MNIPFPLLSLISQKDLISAFLTSCLMSTTDLTATNNNKNKDFIKLLRSLTSTCKEIKLQICSQELIFVMCSALTIDKRIINIESFVEEFYHRFQRDKSYNICPNYHLLWSVKDNDIDTVSTIVEQANISLLCEDSGEFKFCYYEMLLECGRRSGENNNKEIFDILNTELPSHEFVSNLTIFYAGKVYKGDMIKDNELNEVFECKCVCDCKKKCTCECNCENEVESKASLILFEAVRGNNIKMIDKLQSKIVDKHFLQHIMIVGAIASDNLKLLKSLIPNTEKLNRRSEQSIPIIGNELNVFRNFEGNKYKYLDDAQP